jgi:hypothetical protein
MITPRISLNEFDRDRRITTLERQVLILSGQLAARDSAITQLLKEMVTIQADAAVGFVEQYPQMLTEIDTKVLSAITAADEAVEEVSQ